MATEITLGDEIVERIRDWLTAAAAATADPDAPGDVPDFVELLTDLDDLELGEVLPHFQNSIALTPNTYTWWMLIPLGPWTWAADLRDETVMMVEDDGTIEVTTFDEIRSRMPFWLAPGFAVCAAVDLDASDLPFRFDGIMWADTRRDYAFGEGEWWFALDGVKVPFDLSDMDLAFHATEHARAGRWVSIECAGYSMTTGEIGVTLYVTPSGGLFHYQWGYMDSYLGHADADLDVADLIKSLDPEGVGYSKVVAIESDILRKKQMRAVVEWVLAADINPRDRDDIAICCPRWSGTAAELLA